MFVSPSTSTTGLIVETRGDIWAFTSRGNDREYIPYESILHNAVHDNFIECVHLICRSHETCQRLELNQINKDGDTALHITVKDLKLHLAAIFIATPAVDITIRDSCGR